MPLDANYLSYITINWKKILIKSKAIWISIKIIEI